MSVQANLIGTVSVQDTVTNFGPSILLSLGSAGLTAYSYLTNETITTSATPITFPFGVTKAQFIFVQNLGPASLVVSWTPQGGSSNPVITLTPSGKPGVAGGAIVYIEPDLTLGVSALSLQSITNPTVCNVIIAG